jgi:MFS transporter, FSR family, fosmidomycin resistance protein
MSSADPTDVDLSTPASGDTLREAHLGKVTCTWLAEHLGIVGSVVATETTALLIVATLVPMLVILPLLGIVLNGTSSVLYTARTRTGPER